MPQSLPKHQTQNQMDEDLQSSRQPVRIEICGGIASGKTTFATRLRHAGIDAVLENFQANPFWEAFYRDPARHAFETEITFLLQHYHQVKAGAATDKVFVCDFSLLLDLAYATVTLRNSKRKTFLAVYKEVTRDLEVPNLLVHLRCGAATELDRIRRRGRATEESITLRYLDELNNAVERQVAKARKQTEVILIDSEHQNFATEKTIQRELVNLILQHLPEDQRV